MNERDERRKQEEAQAKQEADDLESVQRMIGKMTSSQKASLLRMHKSRQLSELLT